MDFALFLTVYFAIAAIVFVGIVIYNWNDTFWPNGVLLFVSVVFGMAWPLISLALLYSFFKYIDKKRGIK